MKYLGLDLGSKTLGIAISDELGFLARALETYRFESDDYDTIGGYCLQLLDHLPEENETIFTEDDVVIKIKEVDKNRIERIYIRVPKRTADAAH